MPTRRGFLKTVGLGAVGVGLAAPGLYARALGEPFQPTRDPKYREWGAIALAEAKRLGCTYADIRFTRNRSHGLRVRNGLLTNAAGPLNFGDVGDSETYGFGVRVIHGGVWGFSGSPLVTPDEIRRVTGVAADVARASAIARKRDVRLAPVPAYDTFWQTPVETRHPRIWCSYRRISRSPSTRSSPTRPSSIASSATRRTTPARLHLQRDHHRLLGQPRGGRTAGQREHHGMGGDAKGQPVQSNRPSHGSAPCLIRKIMIGAAYS